MSSHVERRTEQFFGRDPAGAIEGEFEKRGQVQVIIQFRNKLKRV